MRTTTNKVLDSWRGHYQDGTPRGPIYSLVERGSTFQVLEAGCPIKSTRDRNAACEYFASIKRRGLTLDGCVRV